MNKRHLFYTSGTLEQRFIAMAFVASGGVSSSNSSLAVTAPPDIKKYDVFISFRGEDTRDNFTSHLHADLRRTGVETYIDYRINKGDDVWTELVKAINDSALFLVIFSENYASSTWCLNELLEIMDCRNNGEAVVIPVFYRVDPSHVRKQSGSYQTAFAKHKKDRKQREPKIRRWMDALSEAASLSGFHSHQYRTEVDLIDDIVKEVLQNLNFKYTNELRGLFIFDENFSNIESLLRIDAAETRIIGIWGMGGIGKTTLAAAIFQKVSCKYEGGCFLENVAEESKRHGLNYIYNKLLSSILKEDLHIDSPKVTPCIILRRLRRKKVFIVLDDVNTSELLANLVGVGRDWLGAGSRVIVTTRDKHVLIMGEVDEIHEAKKKNFQNSLRLFCMNAFIEGFPPAQGYLELSEKVVAYAKGVPLALKVLGSFLRSKSEKEWESALAKLKRIPNAEILKVLRLSYDELDDTEEDIFLDIACFFKGHEMDKVIKILNACGFFADIGIRNLLDKALVTINVNNRIEMHDLIQEMGWEIVREESIKNPGQRSRIWDPEDVCDVLTNNKGTDAVEGILLDMNQITNISISSKAFKNMPNLRFLAFQTLCRDSKKVDIVYLLERLHTLPKNLRYFRWDEYPLKSLPSKFCPEKLVELSLPFNNMEKLWRGVQNLPNLEEINLAFSGRLTECPDLSGAPNLKTIEMACCESLLGLHPSISSLPKLELLNVNRCTSLTSLSGTFSPSLRQLYASNCINLTDFSILLMHSDPSRSHGLDLNLENSGLSELPPSILHTRNLLRFCFPITEGLMDLPENFAQEITLSDSSRREHDALITLTKVFPSSGFRSVRYLMFQYCRRLSELPDNISMLSSLEILALIDCPIISLPGSMKDLPRLKLVEVGFCELLCSIPELPRSIQSLQACNCQSLETVLLRSTCEPSKTHVCDLVSIYNCLKLDQQSYNAILKHGFDKVEVLSAVARGSSGKICYLLPARSDAVREWFLYHSTQAPLFTVELPSNLLGFVFYLVLFQGEEPFHSEFGGSIRCECYLESNMLFGSLFLDKICGHSFHIHPAELMSDHLFIWYDAECCKQVMEAIKEKKGYQPKVTFMFFTQNASGRVGMIKECGLRWIYPLEDQIMEDKGGYKSKRSRDIHDFEATAAAVQSKFEVSNSDEQQEIFPPTKRFKQRIFGTSSNIEADDLSGLLEEILHIGFGGDLMQ